MVNGLKKTLWPNYVDSDYKLEDTVSLAFLGHVYLHVRFFYFFIYICCILFGHLIYVSTQVTTAVMDYRHQDSASPTNVHSSLFIFQNPNII